MATKKKTDNKEKDKPKEDAKGSELDSLLEALREKHGEEAVMKLGDAASAKVETIPTGSLSLDLALGGGLPVAQGHRRTGRI